MSTTLKPNALSSSPVVGPNRLVVWKRLVWKDLRQLLPIWITILFGAAVCLLLINISPLTGGRNLSDYRALTLICCQGFAVLACVINGVLLFALERENRTHQMLSGLPIQPRQVIWAKLLLGLAASFAAILILSWSGALVTQVVSGSSPKSGLLVDAAGGRQALLLIGPIAFFLISAVSALLAGSTMNAFVIAGFLVSIASISSTYIGLDKQFDLSSTFLPAIVLVSLAIVLIGVIVLEAQRWIEGRSRNLLCKLRRESPRIIEVSSVEQVSHAKTEQASRAFLVLMWQSCRIALPKIGLWLLAMVGFAMVFLLSSELEGYLGFFEIGIVVIPACVTGLSLLFCATIFQTDHQGGLYRFCQQHVERPHWFWLTRLIPWLVVVLLLSVLISFTLASVARLMLMTADGSVASHPELLGRYLYDHIFPFTTVILLTALAIGQFWSMFVRNFVIAIVFSLITGGVVYGWIGRLIFIGESLTVFLMPLIVTLFWATWYRSKFWLADFQGWRSYAIPISSVLAVTCLTLCGFAYHRAYSLDDVQLDTNNIAAQLWPSTESRIDQLQFGTPAERQETAKMYREAIDKLPVSSFDGMYWGDDILRNWDLSKKNRALYKSGERGLVEYPDFDRQMVRALVDANQESITLILKASKRIGCDPFLDPDRANKRLKETYLLRSLMMANCLVLLETERNDEALESILAFNRVAQRTAFVGEEDMTHNATGLFYDLLIRWSERPNQDVEKIQKTIRRLEHVASDLKPEIFDYTSLGSNRDRTPEQEQQVASYNWSHYREWRGEAVWFGLIHRFWEIEEGKDIWRQEGLAFPPQSPWERERAKRLLKQLEIERFNICYNRIAGRNDLQRLNPWDERHRFTDAATTFSGDRRAFGLPTKADLSFLQHAVDAGHETVRRYTLLRLALSAYAIENGKYPEHLYQLSDYFVLGLPKTVHNNSNFGWLPNGLPAQGFYKGYYNNGNQVVKPNVPILFPFAIDQPFDITKREPFTLVKDDKEKPREGIPIPVLNEHRYDVSIGPYLSRP